MECELCGHECDSDDITVVLINLVYYWVCPDCDNERKKEKSGEQGLQ
jgi:ribosome-binding protein aMBF1 (putative translation factor)